jgi:Fe-S cluster assembly protein SufB
MSTATETIESLVKQEYKYGFVTDVESESAPPGLNEDIIRLISAKKKEPQWLLDWRLKAYRHWLTMTEPTWQFVKYPPIDFQDIIYYAAPKQKKTGPRVWMRLIRSCWKTYEKLGIRCANAGGWPAWRWTRSFDSVSVGTTFRGN